MEKQRIKSICKSCTRLLIFFFAASLYSQSLTYNMIKQLRITPVAEQMLYTRNDIKFEVTIPYVSPNQVEITIPSDEDGVIFKTLRKTEDMDGTKIELWYNFSKKGYFTLKPLAVKIKNINRQIKFASFSVKLNPKEQTPQLVVEFPNKKQIFTEDIAPSKTVYTATVGKSFKVRMYLQYAVNLLNYKWDLPKNSIFAEEKAYEITDIRLRNVQVSEDLIPVWDFEWTVLKPGPVDFPQFTITVTGYNGVKNEISLPPIKILAEEGHIKEEIPFDNYYSQAFQAVETEKEEIIEEIDLSEIAKSLINTKKIFKISFIIFIALFIVILIALILQSKRKKINQSIILGALLICIQIMIIFFYVKMNKKYGLVTGCKLYSIPEESANSISDIPRGSRVQVKDEINGWLYVEFGQMRGWCDKEMVEVY